MKSTKEPPEPTLDERLTRVPIPHAYALIPDPDRPGKYYAVHLMGVHAERIEHLDKPVPRGSYHTAALSRIIPAMQNRYRLEKGWDQ